MYQDEQEMFQSETEAGGRSECEGNEDQLFLSGGPGRCMVTSFTSSSSSQ